jgi:hypothetical protein
VEAADFMSALIPQDDHEIVHKKHDGTVPLNRIILFASQEDPRAGNAVLNRIATVAIVHPCENMEYFSFKVKIHRVLWLKASTPRLLSDSSPSESTFLATGWSWFHTALRFFFLAWACHVWKRMSVYH